MRAVQQVVAQQVARHEEEPLRAAVARDHDRAPRREVERQLAPVGLAPGQRGWPAVSPGRHPGPLPRRPRSRRAANRSCRAARVHRVCDRGSSSGRGIRRPGGRSRPAAAPRRRRRVQAEVSRRPFAQRVHREDVEHAVAIGGEIDPAVGAPRRATRPPTSPEVSWRTAEVWRSSRNRLAAPSRPSAVRSEAKTIRRPSALGLGSRSWYRSEVSGSSSRRAAGPGRGPTRRCSRQPAQHDALPVGHPVGREQRDELGELVAAAHLCDA